jgi:hypothetical protein
LRPLDSPPAVARTDPVTGFQAFVDDKLLPNHTIAIGIGGIMNPKNPAAAERAVQEL